MSDAITEHLVHRRWVPGHKRVLLPLGDRKGKRSPAEAWKVSCKCGWEAPKPSATVVEGWDVYRAHFHAVASELAAQATSGRQAYKIGGHANLIAPLSTPIPRRPVTGGWSSACACGWRHDSSCKTKRAAREAYGGHLDRVVGDDWPVCKRCEQPTRPSRMSQGSPHLCKPCRTEAA